MSAASTPPRTPAGPPSPCGPELLVLEDEDGHDHAARRDWRDRVDRLLAGGQAPELPALVLALAEYLTDGRGAAHSAADVRLAVLRGVEVLQYVYAAAGPAAEPAAAHPAGPPVTAAAAAALAGALTVTGPVRGLAAGLLLRGLAGGGPVPAWAQQFAALALALCISASQAFGVAVFAAQFLGATAAAPPVRWAGLLMAAACAAQPGNAPLHAATAVASVGWLLRAR